MQKQIDVVYVLGTGSNWDNNEIRFSLRSLAKNLKGMGRVFVVGERPAFLQNVIHIPAKDEFNPNVNADGNIILKVLARITSYNVCYTKLLRKKRCSFPAGSRSA